MAKATFAPASPHLPLPSERVPAEVWLQIIEGADFALTDLVTLTCVSKFVRWLAQPMLFAQISVTMITARQLEGELKGNTKAYLDRLKRRLEFAASQRISYAVRALVIRRNTVQVRQDLDSHDVVGEGDLLAELFSFVSSGSFPHIRSFSAHDATLIPAHFDALAGQSFLSAMHFDKCTVQVGHGGVAELGLDRFHLRELTLHGTISGSFGWWIPLLRSAKLRHISYNSCATLGTDAALQPAGGDKDSSNLFLPALATCPRMTHLRVLHLPSSATVSPCYIAALRQCVSVEELMLDTRNTVPNNWSPLIPHDALPRLKAFFADSHIIGRSFPPTPSLHIDGAKNLNARKLLHITIPDIVTLSGQGNFGNLGDTITQFSDLEELAVMVLTSHDLMDTKNTLEAVLHGLQRLRGLHLSFHPESDRVSCKETWKNFCRLLRAVHGFPHTLRSLHINWQGTVVKKKKRQSQPQPAQGGEDSESSAPESKSSQLLLRHLRKRCPDVVDVNITYGYERGLVWSDPYTRPMKWYVWDARGARSPLPERAV